MSSLVVEVPDSMKTVLDQEIASGRVANHSELFQELVRAEQKHRASNQIGGLAIESLATKATPWTKASMAEIREELRKRGDGLGSSSKK